MNYYKPTSWFQKVEKLVQLHWLAWESRFKPAVRAVTHRNTSVLMVVPQADRVGGYEKQASQLASLITARDRLVAVLTERMNGRSLRELQGGYVIFRIPVRTRPSGVSLLLASVRFLVRHRDRYHVLHAHGVTGFSLLAIRVARWFGKPAVLKPATAGDLQSIFAGTDLKRRAYRRWIAHTDCLIAISDEIEKEMRSCGIPENKIRRFPNFVDTSRFVVPPAERREALRSRFHIARDELVFLYLGRLEERKGVEHLLHAWQKMHGGRLWIVGSGPEEQKLQALSRNLNLSNVVFHGSTAAPLDFYQCADILVFPSLREGTPNVLLEAMSCGLPCIATRIGGVVDLIRHDVDGFLVSPGSADELAHAMEHAASDPADRKRWGESALLTVRERFDASLIAARYLDLYSELQRR